MHKAKFIGMWLATFMLLAIFTAFSVSAATGGAQVYAHSIESNRYFHNKRYFVAFDNYGHSYDRSSQRVCSIDSIQLQTLESQFGATTKQVTLKHGRIVTLVTIPKSGAHKSDIEQVLGKHSHCQVVTQHGIFLLFFKGEVS